MQAFDAAAVKAALDEDGVRNQEVWVCGDCGSLDVQALFWVGMNTDEIFDDGGFDPFCNDCDGETRIIELSDYMNGERR